jgi:hypothetical protein
MATTKILNDLTDDFCQDFSDVRSLFLRSHRCVAREASILDQKNKVAFIVAAADSWAIVYDEVEEEFGIASLTSEAKHVYQVELVGDIAQALGEMMRRLQRA